MGENVLCNSRVPDGPKRVSSFMCSLLQQSIYNTRIKTKKNVSIANVFVEGISHVIGVHIGISLAVPKNIERSLGRTVMRKTYSIYLPVPERLSYSRLRPSRPA